MINQDPPQMIHNVPTSTNKQNKSSFKLLDPFWVQAILWEDVDLLWAIHYWPLSVHLLDPKVQNILGRWRPTGCGSPWITMDFPVSGGWCLCSISWTEVSQKTLRLIREEGAGCEHFWGLNFRSFTGVTWFRKTCISVQMLD